MSRWVPRTALLAAALLGAAIAWVAWRNVAGEFAPQQHDASAGVQATDAANRERGAYLARAGNCAGCHTRRGGAAYAGGRAIATPFGTVFASNLTPDDDTGLGRWSAAEFWRAMHHGRSRDGRLLYPAFPYPNFTRVTRGDADAIFAWLRTLPAVREANRPHALRFPYNLQVSLAVWRALYFEPAAFVPEPDRSAAWNRGSYLVNGLGHCLACHGARNALGATRSEAAAGGAIVESQNWYAPALNAPHEAGVAEWSSDEVVALLKTGVAPRGWAMGPMADVVFRSTQHLSDADLQAMAEYLRALVPAPAPAPRPAPPEPAEPAQRALGTQVYERHCAVCHGEQGQGRDGFPPLAGRRAVMSPRAHNVIKAIRHGGFAPTTAGNPRPMGMPPFGGVLTEAEMAAVASFIRQSWGHEAPAVGALEVLRAR